ncbi:metal ABC transporter solute-binding protein, Zn/Mn family [Leptothermofonsia sichuanensis]|uniref:metal ABC transporter solute-binding protein, Zn/Mn family n=1 Tax=Leptothermofonsia sichuanensis TaxID=2917832 RepID=UPI001CED1EA2|nr:zinc ABC transporter substrate-binding protein [Leptothermofonsia sichuanensis]
MVGLNLRQFVIASLLLPLMAGTGCDPTSITATPEQSSGSQTTASNQQIRVVATFLPVYLFTKAVAGDTAEVDILIKPGTEVHEYQSTPADVQAIARADVLVKNGLGIEEFLEGTLKSAENPKLKVIDASAGIEPLKEISPVVVTSGGKASNHDHDHHDHHEHDHGEAAGEPKGAHVHADGNPHVWLDPLLAKKQVENIRDGLVAADPANEPVYRANAAAYIQRLSKLDSQFEQTLKPYQNRTFITFHDAFPYLARRYQLKQEAVVAIPEDQLSPRDVQETIEAVKRFNVKALFSEPGVDNKLLVGIAKDMNLKIYPLDSLESGPLDPDYYFTAMESNLKTLETAFR